MKELIVHEVADGEIPHSVYYKELTEAIWFVAVAPQARRPYYWQRRLSTPPKG